MGSIYENFDMELKYKYGGSRAKMGKALEEEERKREEERREKLLEPLERRCSELSVEVVSLMEQNRALEKAGDRMADRIQKWLDGELPGAYILLATYDWKKAKEESK